MKPLRAIILGSISATLVSTLITYCLLSLGFTLTSQIYSTIGVLLPTVALTGALIGLLASLITSRDWIIIVSACLGWLVRLFGGVSISLSFELRELAWVVIVGMGVVTGLLITLLLSRLNGRT